MVGMAILAALLQTCDKAECMQETWDSGGERQERVTRRKKWCEADIRDAKGRKPPRR